MKNTYIIPGIIIALLVIGGIVYTMDSSKTPKQAVIPDALPKNVRLSGTYICLPHQRSAEVHTQECAFGLLTDDGKYYAVNFGQSADQAALFNSGAHVVADGFIVSKEALNSDHWKDYTMEGIFTTTAIIESTPGSAKNVTP